MGMRAGNLILTGRVLLGTALRLREGCSQHSRHIYPGWGNRLSTIDATSSHFASVIRYVWSTYIPQDWINMLDIYAREGRGIHGGGAHLRRIVPVTYYYQPIEMLPVNSNRVEI